MATPAKLSLTKWFTVKIIILFFKNTELRESKEEQGRRSFIPSNLSNVNELCSNCCRPLGGDKEVAGKAKDEYQKYVNSTALNAPKNETQYNSSDSSDDPTVNGVSRSNLKRSHDFEDEQQHKKRKKGKSFFSCFGGKWLRNNKRSKKY